MFIKNSIFAEIFYFIYKPSLYRTSAPSYKKNYDTLFIYFVILILGNCISLLVHYLVDTPKRTDDDINLSFNFIFLSCFFLPLIEEIVFRLSLVFSRCNLSLTIAGISFIIVNNFLKVQALFTEENYYSTRIIVSIFLSMLIGILFYFASKKYEVTFAYFFKNNFRIIYYLSALIFAILHISNFEINLHYFLIYPLMILPSIFFGLAVGFVRVKYGFFYSVFIHVINNMVPTMIFIYFFK